jgi:adenosylcobinamide-GDP ribazoletransferase
MKAWLRDQGLLFAAATGFLTRLPVGSAGRAAEPVARSGAYFPLVGALVGLVAAAVYFLATLVWSSPLLPALLALCGATLLTGALHEDGLADVFDAFGASRDRDRILTILADSRIGTYGALALIGTLVTKLLALDNLSPERVPGALIAAHAIGRWAALAILWRMPYVRPRGTGEGLAGRLTTSQLAAASILTAALAAAALGWQAVPALLAVLGANLLARLFFRRRLGGVTGDCLGAAVQLTETAVYLVLGCRLLGPSCLWGL